MSERLPGYELLCKGGFGCSSLWLGQDHLLYIEGTGFLFPVHERYRRIRYADIESVTLQRNRVRSVGGILLTVVVVVAAGCIATMWPIQAERAGISDVGLGVLLGSLLLGMTLLVRHLSRGVGCVSEVVTRLGRVQPRPLRRWRSADSALRRLAERVRSERGDDEWRINNDGGRKAPGLSGWTLLTCRMTGGISLLLSGLLVAMIVLGLTGKVVAMLLSILALIAVSSLQAGLALISRRKAQMELRLSLWSLLVAFCLILIAGLAQFSVLVPTRPDLATEMLAFAQMFGRVEEFSPDAVATFFLLLSLGSAVISAIILVLTFGAANSAQAVEKKISTAEDS